MPPAGYPFPVRPFKAILKDMAVIAEVKYATPKDGLLGITDDPATIAREYERLGASAISCLTVPEYFAGCLEYIGIIRSSCSLPVMMKDFIVDERQIKAGRALGADAFLLITEMLSLKELKNLFACGKDLGMECLVEVHSLDGLGKAVAVNAEIIGVNSRDLKTLQVDHLRHEELAGHIPSDVVKVAESGITSGTRLSELNAFGYDAVLIGRAFADRTLREDIFHVGKDLRHHQGFVGRCCGPKIGRVDRQISGGCRGTPATFGATATLAAALAAVAAAVEEEDVVGDHFDGLALAAVLGFPFTPGQPPVHADPAALGQVVGGGLGGATEHGDVEVVRAVRPVAAFVASPAADRESQRADRLATGRVPEFRVAGEATDERYAVEIGGHRLPARAAPRAAATRACGTGIAFGTVVNR